jgi:SAM-dependent methyltransferase
MSDRAKVAAGEELARQYERRFAGKSAYRNDVWQILCRDFFQKYVRPNDCVLDLGSGYGQFINHIVARTKYAMDLNPNARSFLSGSVTFYEQDCSTHWSIPDGALDVVFTSNFLEHLPDKDSIRRTLLEASRCLRSGGRIVCLGPNVRYVPGAYWDFWDHHVALSDRTLSEVLELTGFDVAENVPRFLPYTMADGPTTPLPLVRAYLHLPAAWPIFGRQFLIVATRT